MDKYDLHQSLCEKLNPLYRKKNADYDDSVAKGIDEDGFITVITRMEDKLRRAKRLLGGCNPNVSDETIQDTLIDL